MKKISILFCALLFSVIVNAQEEDPEVVEEEVFVIVETMPCHPDCADLTGEERNDCTNSKIHKHIAKTVNYPEVAIENNVSGMVVVNFIVDKQGNITEVRVVRSVHPALDAEAIRVVKLLPQFIPGTQLGRAVRVQYNLPVRFTLTDPGVAPSEDDDKGKKKKRRKKD